MPFKVDRNMIVIVKQAILMSIWISWRDSEVHLSILFISTRLTSTFDMIQFDVNQIVCIKIWYQSACFFSILMSIRHVEHKLAVDINDIAICWCGYSSCYDVHFLCECTPPSWLCLYQIWSYQKWFVVVFLNSRRKRKWWGAFTSKKIIS